LLLVDSTQSIQAQTLANYNLAKKRGLQIVPVVTKIDLPNAAPDDAALTMASTFKLDVGEVIMTSAKRNINIRKVLEAVVDRLPSPEAASRPADGKFFGRIVDSWFDEHRGVVCLVQCVGGSLREGQRITTLASLSESAEGGDCKVDFSVQDIGVLTGLGHLRTGLLRTGQVGYVISGMRSIRQAKSGDTMYTPVEWGKGGERISALEGYETSKPMIFASVFP
jgi:translation elongation factor EF-4